MRKIFLCTLAALAISFSVNAQTNKAGINNIKEINFYGVDFSLVKTYGLKETSVQIKGGLSAINSLFVAEQNKYDVGKYMKKTVLTYDMKNTDKHNETLDKEKFISNTDKVDALSESDIQSILGDLSCEKNDKTGLVFIADLLNKTKVTGTFYVVFFDEATKEIIYSKQVSGKPGGFGVRNYWAGAVLNILKDWRY